MGPAVAVGDAVDDGALGVGEEDEAAVDLQVLLGDEVVDGAVQPADLIALAAEANAGGSTGDEGGVEEGGDRFGAVVAGVGAVVAGDEEEPSESSGPRRGVVADVDGGGGEGDLVEGSGGGVGRAEGDSGDESESMRSTTIGRRPFFALSGGGERGGGFQKSLLSSASQGISSSSICAMEKPLLAEPEDTRAGRSRSPLRFRDVFPMWESGCDQQLESAAPLGRGQSPLDRKAKRELTCRAGEEMRS